jgi:hypothetical protein
VLLQGAAGRQLRGLYRDARSGLVWAAGNIGVPDTAGSEARVWAVDGASGAVVANVLVPGARFLNDLVATHDAVWVTDSRVDRLTRIAVTAGGLPTGADLEFRTLGGAWPAFTGSTNANGIRELPDGSLVLNNSSTGGLFRVDTATGHATAIPVKGGPGLVGGDGLEIDGTTLYDVRGSGQHEVSVLELVASPLARGPHRRHARRPVDGDPGGWVALGRQRAVRDRVAGDRAVLGDAAAGPLRPVVLRDPCPRGTTPRSAAGRAPDDECLRPDVPGALTEPGRVHVTGRGHREHARRAPGAGPERLEAVGELGDP